jgi:EAL domain-containing protein (putative c-di-GMP-specific phosphodiesterase class I)
MYVSKANKNQPISFFNISMKKDASKLLSMEKSLKEAIENNEFVMYYQPIFDQLKKITGSESLIRWNHPENGLLAPGDFIVIAEQTGIIHELGRWIIDTVFKQIKSWQDQNLRVLPVSINISLLQFKSSDLINHLEYCITKYNLDPQLITLELTESIAVEDYSSALKKLNKLKKIGFKIALDDFGTGYSSLNYLANLPFDILKIDKSFTSKIGEETNSDTLIETIVLMAKKLKLNIIAEGVETEKQFGYLKELGCEKYQGYLVSKPLPILKFNELLND